MPHMVWSFQNRFVVVVVVVGSLSSKIVAHWLFVPVGPFCFHSLHCILYTKSLLPLPSIPISNKSQVSVFTEDKDGGHVFSFTTTIQPRGDFSSAGFRI